MSDGFSQQPLVFFFGQGRADGTSAMKDILGGKGTGLASIAFFESIHLNYVSCSPFRVPIARLAAAQAALATRGTVDRTRATV